MCEHIFSYGTAAFIILPYEFKKIVKYPAKYGISLLRIYGKVSSYDLNSHTIVIDNDVIVDLENVDHQIPFRIAIGQILHVIGTVDPSIKKLKAFLLELSSSMLLDNLHVIIAEQRAALRSNGISIL
ncbi:hypothetical protein GJ496_000270 [Pomphorhynchus laevis]|nr:hypothetical protein GJ496_000270 [Pomphorhynchus laevis]